MNHILLLRLNSVYRRVGRFIKNYYKDFIFKYFKVKKSECTSPLETTKIVCFSTIAEYLNNREIGKLMLTSKLINKRIEKKVIWENLFVNEYLKMADNYKRCKEITSFLTEEEQRLDNMFRDKVYSMILIDELKEDYKKRNFNFKALCQKAHFIFNNEEEIPEHIRDRFIGLTNVLIEETFDSIFRAPHLILLPFKLIGIIIYIFPRSLSYIIFNKSSSESKNHYDRFEKIIDNNLFFNSQLLIFESIFMILQIFFITISKIFKFTIVNFFDLITLSLFFPNIRFHYISNTNTSNEIEIEEKEIAFDGKISWNRKIKITFIEKLYKFWQYIIAFIILILYVLMIFSPTLYFRNEGIRNILHSAFYDDHNIEKYILIKSGKSRFLSIINWWHLFEGIFNVIWAKTYFKIFMTFMGNYCLHYPSSLVTFTFVKFLEKNIKNPIIKIQKSYSDYLLNEFFIKNGIINCLQPQIIVFIIYLKLAKGYPFLKDKILLNLIATITILAPFSLNFYINLTFFRIIVINAWAVTGFFRFSKMMKNIKF